MLNVRRNHLQAFNSLGISCLLLVSFYPFVASLLDVGNGGCFLKHIMVSHRTMVPMSQGVCIPSGGHLSPNPFGSTHAQISCKL